MAATRDAFGHALIELARDDSRYYIVDCDISKSMRTGDAEIVVTNKTVIDEAVLAACPNIRYIGVLATGYNVVDIEAARERGIPVTNVPAYGTDAVAQFAIALLLEICHNIGHHNDEVRKGRWTNNEDFCFWDYPLVSLAGKTMGIIGLGRIGQATARIAKAIGMDVIAYDKFESDDGRKVARYVELDELLEKSDVISLHCPLLPETEGIINKDTISKMRDGVIILNNSRGQLIVDQDLADALNSGKVYAAGLDVLSVEPPSADNPLLTAKNCIVTPHISWAAKECRQRLMDCAVENLRSFLNNRSVNVVNT
jgi:glycerate dehydrogenase